MLSFARRYRRSEDLGELGSIERFGSSARGRPEPLISAAENEEMIGCGPNEKDDPIETRLRELAVDGRRGICGTTKAPAGGGVEVMLQSILLRLRKGSGKPSAR